MQLQERHKTSSFRNKAGQNIFYRNWKDGSSPKGIMIIIHGLNSHSGYYENFALQLNENNYEVYAIDLRGRGHSDGERYYTSDYRDVVEDIDQLLNIAKSVNPASPVFLFGHSAGGVFASVYAADHQSKLKGLISVSFAFQVPAHGFALAAIKLLGHIIPHVRLVKLNNTDFSRNKSMVEAMNNDPLIANEKQPAKSTQQLLLAADYLKTKMPEITLSLLILHGTADKVTKPSGSNYFMAHASSTDKQLKLYEGHYHDLLNDRDNQIVVSDIVRWLDERV
jgi:alpha-beta hydrolase superfamily lysophospholipase